MPEVEKLSGKEEVVEEKETIEDNPESEEKEEPWKDPEADPEAEDEGKEEEGAEADKEEKEEKAKAPDKDEEEEDDGSEPPVKARKTAKDYIIERKNRKLNKKAEEKTGEDDLEEDDEEEDDDDIVTERDEKIITKVVLAKFAPIIEKSIEADDNTEVEEFLKENPDFKQFEAKARRFMKHPSRSQLPIKSIFYEVAGDKLMKIGAERKAIADKKAKAGQTGGGSNRGAGEGATKPVWSQSEEEFEASQEKVRRG